MSTDSLPTPTAGIQKMPTGIIDFDAITGGGLPRHRTTLVMGTPGSGKTVFALQLLMTGATRWEEPGIFVAFEENSRQIIQNAATFGWDLPALEQDGLFFLDARMSPDAIQAGDFDLIGMLASLSAKAAQMGAKRIVFDSIDVLLALLDNRLAERRELYRINDWLAASGLTGVLTARSEGEQPLIAHRYDFLQYMADCVVLLQHAVRESISRRSVRILKYRGSSFSENEFPLLITTSGIEIFGSGGETEKFPVYNERVSTGVASLDALLDGGYLRGTTVLMTGLPGTAKTTLCGLFLEAACQRGERALFVSIDESREEVVRNLASVGIDLQTHLDSGLLQMYWSSRESRSAEEHLIILRRYITEHKPDNLVINPLWMMLQSGGTMLNLISNTQRLMLLTKNAGITSIFTSLLAEPNEYSAETPYQISTLADTWVHLSYVLQAGERNRGLSVVKARGTRHSTEVHEMILNDDGVMLKEAFAAGGQVVMGKLRSAIETDNDAERERLRLEVEKQRADLELAEAQVDARDRTSQLDLEIKRANLRLAELKQARQQADSSGSRQASASGRTEPGSVSDTRKSATETAVDQDG